MSRYVEPEVFENYESETPAPPRSSITSATPTSTTQVRPGSQCQSAALKKLPAFLDPNLLACLTAVVPTERVKWLLELGTQDKGPNWVKQLTVDITKKLPQVRVTVELFRFIPIDPRDGRL